jgi:hypothetical protein
MCENTLFSARYYFVPLYDHSLSGDKAVEGEAGTHLHLLLVFLMRETTSHFPMFLMTVVPNSGLGQIHASTFTYSLLRALIFLTGCAVK